ncbi:hypothetical protein EUGRSUZ_J01545 [Eucalyptus grandis]|uniref:Uncharacterized protein n=2 Tax=Eucalyptus grandis TaxID=71139 RepID=A0ACC3J6S7_EUCGR|nr:hypothetical protein EUGRSUZ_J01545 [Eucalyptus grandis]
MLLLFSLMLPRPGVQFDPPCCNTFLSPWHMPMILSATSFSSLLSSTSFAISALVSLIFTVNGPSPRRGNPPSPSDLASARSDAALRDSIRHSSRSLALIRMPVDRTRLGTLSSSSGNLGSSTRKYTLLGLSSCWGSSGFARMPKCLTASESIRTCPG